MHRTKGLNDEAFHLMLSDSFKNANYAKNAQGCGTEFQHNNFPR